MWLLDLVRNNFRDKMFWRVMEVSYLDSSARQLWLRGLQSKIDMTRTIPVDLLWSLKHDDKHFQRMIPFQAETELKCAEVQIKELKLELHERLSSLLVAEVRLILDVTF